uniref:Uncharacterized protein n=1 Tax=Oryza nivara TaxID=4536 RepID=A0A0E0IH11_ORYNI
MSLAQWFGLRSTGWTGTEKEAGDGALEQKTATRTTQGSFVEGELLCLSRIFCGGLYKQTVDAVMCILLHTKYHPLQSHVCCYTLLTGIHSSCPEPGGRGVRFPRRGFYSDYMLSLGKTELSCSRTSFSLADLCKFAQPQLYLSEGKI